MDKNIDNILTREQLFLARYSLLFYSHMIFQHFYKMKNYNISRHHEIIIQYLERVIFGKCPRLIINMPPRHGKTEFAVKLFMTYCFGLNPRCKFIVVSYSFDLTKQHNKDVRLIMQSDVYREIFPHTKISRDDNSSSHFSVDFGDSIAVGSAFFVGSGGAITGRGAGTMDNTKFSGCIIIDDPNKASDITSPKRLEEVWNHYNNTISTRSNNMIGRYKTPTIIIMQRLHDNDLTGRIIEKEKKDWKIVKLKVFDLQGNPLWKYRIDCDELAKIKKRDPFVFQTQYMQEPVAPECCLFRWKDFQFYSYKTHKFNKQHIVRKIITVDTAQKVKTVNDFSVFQCWLKIRDDEQNRFGKIYLLNQFRKKMEYPELRIALKSFIQMHDDAEIGVNSIYIEDKSSGTQLIQELNKDNINIVAVGRGNQSKVDRAMFCLNHIIEGRVYINTDLMDFQAFKYEICSFNIYNTQRHDDQVDCMVDAISYLFNMVK